MIFNAFITDILIALKNAVKIIFNNEICFVIN